MRVVFVTCAPGEGAGLVGTLVSERLVACGNILPGVRSIYRWKGEICDDAEEVLLMETTAQLVPALMDRIQALHSYETPKVLVLEPTAGLPDYLAWVQAQTATD